MMPKPGQSMEAFMRACADAAGENSPRATPAQIERLKALGYKVDSFEEEAEDGPITGYQWFASNGEFQDIEPSYEEGDCWAAALQHAIANLAGWEKA